MKNEDFKATEPRTGFTLGEDRLQVDIQTDNKHFAWRLCVNGDWSEWTKWYEGILVHKGFGVATAYWDGSFSEFVPFKITPTTPT